MKLTEAIWRFQNEGDRGLLARVHLSMNLDDMARRRRLGLRNEPEATVGLRCLRLLAAQLSVIPAELARHGIDPKREDPERIFEEYAEPVHDATGIVLTIYNYERHADALRSYLGSAYPPLFAAYQRLIGVRPSVCQLLAARIVDKYWGVLEHALEQAVLSIDLSRIRSDGEAGAALNKTVRRFVRGKLQSEAVRYPAVEPFVEPDYFGAVYAIFGQADIRYERFTKSQRRLIERIRLIVEEDAAYCRFDEYDVDKSGGYRIRPRYVARRLGLTEERLCKALVGARRAVAAAAAESAGRR